MATSRTIIDLDQQRITAALDQAAKKLDGNEKEVVLDFSCVRRIDSGDVRRLAEFAHAAEEKKVRVLLGGVDIDIYKVLKLTKLTREFGFVN